VFGHAASVGVHSIDVSAMAGKIVAASIRL
jgi:hypothetical protein